MACYDKQWGAGVSWLGVLGLVIFFAWIYVAIRFLDVLWFLYWRYYDRRSQR